MLIKFAGGNHYYQQMNWLHFLAKLEHEQRHMKQQEVRIDVYMVLPLSDFVLL